MNFVGMDYINSQYKKRQGNKTCNSSLSSNKNNSADLLREIADAAGADLSLLHEKRMTNQRFLIPEEAADVVYEILDMGRDTEGRKFRCRNYIGAGGRRVELILHYFCVLFRFAGVPEDEIKQQWFEMLLNTDYISLTHHIKQMSPHLTNDVENVYFQPTDTLASEDTMWTAADRYVLYQFMLSNPDISRSDMRGVYWSFHTEVNLRGIEEMRTAAASIKRMTEKERERLKASWLRHIHFQNAMQEDLAFLGALKDWVFIESGQGKLQDNKRRKKLSARLSAELVRIADQYYEKKAPDELGGKRIIKPKITQADVDDSAGRLSKGIEFYCSLKVNRENAPISKESMTLFEITYQDFFGEPLFPLAMTD